MPDHGDRMRELVVLRDDLWNRSFSHLSEVELPDMTLLVALYGLRRGLRWPSVSSSTKAFKPSTTLKG